MVDYYFEQGVPWYWIGDPAAVTLEEYHHTLEGYVRTVSGTLDRPLSPRDLPGFSIDLGELVELADGPEEQPA